MDVARLSCWKSVRHGIESEIGENLPERPRVAVHRKIGLGLNIHGDVAVPQLAVQTRKNLFGEFAGIECAPVEMLLISGRLLERLHQFGSPAEIRHELDRCRTGELDEI